MAFVNVNGIKLYYSKTGNGKKILILHDGLLDSSSWQESIDYLSKNYEVIIYDRRGYGESDIPEGMYSNLEDLKAFTDEIGIENTFIIAGSMGGGLAIDFTLSYPEKVIGLILIGAVINGYAYSEQMNIRNYGNYQPLIERQDVEGCIRKWSEDKYLISEKNNDARLAFYKLLCKNYKNITNDPRMITNDNIDAINKLDNIDKPTMVIVGEDDISDVYEQANILKNKIQNSEYKVINECGHLAYFEKPNEANSLFSEFIEKNSVS